MLQISSHLKTQIEHAAVSAYPLECCGLMLGQRLQGQDYDTESDSRQVVEFVPADNQWDGSVQDITDPTEPSSPGPTTKLDRHRRYWIDPNIMLKVQRGARDRKLDIIGIYHSHPDHPAVPSECDRRLAWPVYSYVIVSAAAGGATDFRSWRLSSDHQFESEAVKIVDKICP